jgi:hypothetical protein
MLCNPRQRPIHKLLVKLTFFGEGYFFPGIICERYDALRDDKFLNAGGESSVEYACGPSNGPLEKHLINQLAENEVWRLQTSRMTSGVPALGSGDATWMMASAPRMYSAVRYRDSISPSRTSDSSLQVRRDQVVNDDSGKSVAEGFVVLANTSDVVAPHCTDSTTGGKNW